MDERYIDEYYEFLVKNQERLKTDEQLVRKTLTSHLSHVPKKLYKYRTCNRQNFKALKEKQIYMPCADDFKDPFDYTLNFDLSKQTEELERFFKSNIDQMVFLGIQGLLKKVGVRYSKFSLKDVKIIRENYFLEDGTCLEEKFEKEIVSRGKSTEVSLYKRAKEFISTFVIDNEAKIHEMAESMAEKINEMSRQPREKSLVYCMTEDNSCGPMWENYAGGYSGFCVEYDFSNWEDKPFDEIKNLIYLLPVIYFKEKPVFNMEPFFELATKQHVFGEKIGKNIPLQIDLNKQLLRKQSDYDYEKEWRFSIKNEGNHLQPFSFVSAIYMGKDILEKDIAHLKVVAKKLKIPLYKQTLNYFGNEFRYEKVEV